MRRFLLIVTASLLTAVPAMANGAMGLGLEQWDPNIWFIYVAAMTTAEAWLMGRLLGLGAPESIFVSFLANMLTGVGCGLMGCAAPFLHFPLVGSTADPNPLLSALSLLAVFAFPSALFEGILWDRMYRKQRKYKPSEQGVLGRLLLIHLVLVPVGLAILLIPDRPYRGYEAFAKGARRMELRQFKNELAAFISEQRHIPRASTMAELLKEVPDSHPLESRKRSLVFPYVPTFGRFSMGEDRSVPYRLNTTISGRKVDPESGYDEPQWAWYIEPPTRDSWGFRIELQSGMVEFVKDPRQMD